LLCINIVIINFEIIKNVPDPVRELFITRRAGRILLQGYLMYVQVYYESRLDLVEGGRELIIRRAEPVDRGEYTCTAHLKYPPNVQVYNENRLDLVEGGTELIIRGAEPVDRGEYTCTAHPKYPPNVQVYNESRLDLVEGGR
jgi:hypothetical protein